MVHNTWKCTWCSSDSNDPSSPSLSLDANSEMLSHAAGNHLSGFVAQTQKIMPTVLRLKLPNPPESCSNYSPPWCRCVSHSSWIGRSPNLMLPPWFGLLRRLDSYQHFFITIFTCTLASLRVQVLAIHGPSSGSQSLNPSLASALHRSWSITHGLLAWPSPLLLIATTRSTLAHL